MCQAVRNHSVGSPGNEDKEKLSQPPPPPPDTNGAAEFPDQKTENGNGTCAPPPETTPPSSPVEASKAAPEAVATSQDKEKGTSINNICTDVEGGAKSQEIGGDAFITFASRGESGGQKSPNMANKQYWNCE